MANPEQMAKLDGSIEAWNQWRALQATPPDLIEGDLSGKNLCRADLRGANLRGANFEGSNLDGADLRESDLQGANLGGAKGGLKTEQLAGADLTGATLPEGLKKLFDTLQNVNNISESARKLFLAVLATSLYSWLTIATTTDANLITNRASSPLPIIQTSIPIVGFYVVAPLLLLCVYFYFHFYLQKLWEELSSLPAILPDGRPLHARIDPWLLNDLVRSHLPKLNIDRPFLSYFQLWISVLLAWWTVPITMFLFWGHYLPRHEPIGTTFHVLLLIVSMTGALCLYRLAVATLRGTERKPFRWGGMLTSRRGYQTATFAIAAGMLFGIISGGAIMGVPVDGAFGKSLVKEPRQWVPRLMALFGYSPFASFPGAEISQKKSTWSKGDADLDSVVGAQLEGVNLRHAKGSGAFLARADLQHADLSAANFDRADLSSADMSVADLDGALLDEAKMSHAHLVQTHMEFAYVSGADLTGATLREADLFGAILWHAQLGGADFESADLANAELSDADLRNANLRDAKLGSAKLNGADLGGADLKEAVFNNTDLSRSRLLEAKNLDPKAVKMASHWDLAFYDDDILKALGLPPDHNAKLAEQQKQALEQK